MQTHGHCESRHRCCMSHSGPVLRMTSCLAFPTSCWAQLQPSANLTRKHACQAQHCIATQSPIHSSCHHDLCYHDLCPSDFLEPATYHNSCFIYIASTSRNILYQPLTKQTGPGGCYRRAVRLWYQLQYGFYKGTHTQHTHDTSLHKDSQTDTSLIKKAGLNKLANRASKMTTSKKNER